MKIDVLIEYDPKLSEVTFSSKAAQFSETRTARIGLSHAKTEDISSELVEFVGEDWEIIKKIEDWFSKGWMEEEYTGKSRTGKDYILRTINPFEASTFEPQPAFAMVRHFAAYMHLKLDPNSSQWRFYIKFFNPYEITLKIPGYNFFEPQKKLEFEKLLHTRFKSINIIS